MHCAKGDFPHAQYVVYLHAIDTWRTVKCGIAAVTWCDVTAITVAPHIPFRILPSAFRTPQFRILPIASTTSLSLPGQFTPWSELANRTLANSLPGTFAPRLFHSRDTRRFRVLIGNNRNGAMYFSAYPEPSNHAHSLHVYF